MYQLKSLEDTIAAISTATGQGGIGIVRLSGKDALTIADKIFETKSAQKPSQFKTYTVHYGWIKKGDEIIDEALLTVMRAPTSYTCEDVVEISCHGGVVPLKAVLELCLECGARLSEPGEFTKRAFLNGRIDLAQAEAVLDVIQSKTDAFLKVSHHQLRGELSIELESIRQKLMDVYTEIEAIVNFPEDDIDAAGLKTLLSKVGEAKKRVEVLLQSSEHGKILKEGIKIVLCGRPNVGKSSVLNILLRQPRAIVTDIAGTTRDTIEETAQIKGIPFQLVDTAGILEPRDMVEEEAIKRSHMYIEGADLILFVLDGSTKMCEDDLNLTKHLEGKNVIVIVNKIDLEQKFSLNQLPQSFKQYPVLKISALKNEGVESLEDSIVDNVWHGKAVDTQGVLLSNIRHVNALEDCLKDLQSAQKILDDHASLEIVSEEVKSAINLLDNITGRNIDADLLDKIFSEFCIGK